MLPNFIVVGAAKCGTTSICDLLGEHPDVFMSDPKEPCYFSHMDQENRTRAWYEALFSHADTASAVGEGSTAYTHPDVIDTTARRIYAAIPNCRLIYMVRHPVRRLESDWRMRRHEGWTPASISEAVSQQPSLIGHCLYWKNINAYRKVFPDEQILIVFLEDFVADPQKELRRCFEHIFVDPDVVLDDASRARNSASSYRKDSRIASRVRTWRSFEELKSRLPSWMVTSAKHLLTRKEKFVPDWAAGTRERVVEAIRDDTRLFLSHCGKQPDFWRLAD